MRRLYFLMILALIGCDSGNISNQIGVENSQSQTQEQSIDSGEPTECELVCERLAASIVVTEFCDGVEVSVEEVSPARAPIGCFPAAPAPLASPAPVEQ